MNKTTNTVDLAAGIRQMDEYVVHPWESFDAESGPNTVINSGGGVYVYDSDGNRLLDAPHYTRPRVWRERPVPEVLISGDHGAVDAWRRAEMEQRTRDRRPDLLDTKKTDPTP